MTEEEIRAAASSAAERTGADRIEFIQNSYPVAYWAEILQLAAQYTNNFENIGREII